MAWTDAMVRAVWRKGKAVAGNDPDKWRLDACGAWMGWDFYGNRNSEYGWEVDHIIPKDKGGSDAIENLRPLQWENNASKSDGKLVCVVQASGINNASIAR